ncbi:cathepsin O [Colossoma macropomum]|uniref:cathepsin O n=1 Tax=Colossoma macropomum TaxID=42526 RepID=UPI0018643056|nr:cathepsin O [Colossoma macropomum]
MARVEALTVLLSCHFLLARFSNGELLEMSEELTGGGTFRRGTNSEQHIQTWRQIQASVKRQAYLNLHSMDFQLPAKYGINLFSHLSPEQFRDIYLRAWPEVAPKYNMTKHGRPGSERYLPRFDWREHGAVGPVQNQQSCGGCWAFSVVAAIEAVHVKDGGKLQDLSVQQVIDCDYKSQGCNGGSTVSALEWLKQTKEKLVNETEYPYKAETGLCRVFPQLYGGVSVKDYTAFDFSGQEELMMERLVDWGPLVVIVDATSWQDYLGGVIQHHCSSRHANHAVLIIGYDTTGEVPFWIVRNSWGTSWGNGGYVYVKMGDNMCGIADTVAGVFL